MERPRIPRGPVSHAFKIGAIAAAVRFLLICLHFLHTAVYVSCKKRHISSLLTQFMYHIRGRIYVSHLQTWDLSKNLHDQIFGPKILHIKRNSVSALISVMLVNFLNLRRILFKWYQNKSAKSFKENNLYWTIIAFYRLSMLLIT